ncbi:alpha-glucosidase/alpha-galactosidase [Leadbettera azotonutricia]|uniref:Alpha-galactosidase (Melibiase) n=1 Tax=Leadbettera azotonutricia (strain ATCC BAA-888 / DSM 13862 / ZAS-9) TaxID=545695 RepID=F5Y7E4_LEAAZ|nr:alpha-glucosidase/alpha-galactosidase [Leadbettera azotonutricia]AEF81400.1 alpha-galactosidase (Melibiase) [Leadbettera azotonutricia ZAS-9]
MKIAFIGAGSVGFTRKLAADILTVPELRDTEICLQDISAANLEMIYHVLDRDIKANKLGKVKLTKTTEQKKAIEGAKYVVSVARVGGLDAFALDVEIPLKYGVNQCVGDTICAGGIMYGQRTIPVIMGICKDMKALAEPGAVFLNYSNPNAMNTWAANTYGGIQTLGLCHGVQHGHEQIAEVLGLPMNEVDIICAGINHQTWYIQIKHKGVDMRDKLLAGFKKHPRFKKEEKIRIDILERFGYYSTESNGHLSEYLPWYRKRPQEIDQWIDYSSWINGEPGGYLRVCREGRAKFEKEAKEYQTMKPLKYTPRNRSSEHGSHIIEGLETGRIYRGHFNVINKGSITNLPADCVVEVPGYADGNGISIPIVGDLPAPLAAICNASIAVQRLSVEAALEGDPGKLKQAMLLDPLTGAVCNPPEVWKLADDMLKAESKWLPQYQKYIKGLK